MGKEFSKSTGRPSKSFTNGSGSHGMNSYRNNGRGSLSGSYSSISSNSFNSPGSHQSGYGQGKHSKGGKPKQNHNKF